jgi:hypothetical protein
MATNIETTIFDIVSISIVSPSIGTVDLKDFKFLVEDFNIYESIFNSVVSGHIIIKDATNQLSKLCLSGTEFIFISFIKDEYSAPYEKTFRIYKISDVALKNNTTTITYRIDFCSEEFILDHQIRISKSYKGFYNVQIAADILVNYLGVNPEKITLEQTLVPHDDFIIPNLKPFEALNMLTAFSFNNNLTSAFLFYETVSGYKFQSLESLFNVDDVKTIYLRPQNVSNEEDSLAGMDYISDFNITQLFNVLQTMSTGGYSSSMIKMDLVNQNVNSVFSDPVNSTPITLLNSYLPFNDAKNRFNNTLIDGSAYSRYYLNIKGGLIDKIMLQRAHQLALLNNYKIHVTIAGDTNYEAGQVINVDFPYLQPINEAEETQQDPYKAGRHLLTAVRHRILENKYICYLELCKDSVLQPFPGAVADDSQLLTSAKTS